MATETTRRGRALALLPEIKRRYPQADVRCEARQGPIPVDMSAAEVLRDPPYVVIIEHHHLKTKIELPADFGADIPIVLVPSE